MSPLPQGPETQGLLINHALLGKPEGFLKHKIVPANYAIRFLLQTSFRLSQACNNQNHSLDVPRPDMIPRLHKSLIYIPVDLQNNQICKSGSVTVDSIVDHS